VAHLAVHILMLAFQVEFGNRMIKCVGSFFEFPTLWVVTIFTAYLQLITMWRLCKQPE
jgi:hypothetical protein